MHLVDRICTVLILIMGVLVFYKSILTVLGIIAKKKVYQKAEKLHNYGVVIAARNEEKVIGQLLDSINKQHYNREIKVFVVADNCDDNTAEVARGKGAVVYERFNKKQISKGYALQFLFEHIEKDYGILSLDGYFVFDADNLLNLDFVDKMNDAFDTGLDMVTSYRATKNFDTNFISAAYGIHFCRHSLIRHRPRGFLNTSTQLTGTGFLIKSDVIKDGWDFVSLTEDAEITTKTVAKGKKVGFCESAIFYDEQPYDMKIVFRQRLRWAKGRLNNYFKNAHLLLLGLFKSKSLREKFSCYDLYFTYFPHSILSFVVGLIYPLISIIASIATNNFIFAPLLRNLLIFFGTQYVTYLVTGIITVIREYKHIHCSTAKLVYFLILWPWFDFFELPINLVAIFADVKWKPIKHDDSRSIDDIILKSEQSKAAAEIELSEIIEDVKAK